MLPQCQLSLLLFSEAQLHHCAEETRKVLRLFLETLQHCNVKDSLDGVGSQQSINWSNMITSRLIWTRKCNQPEQFDC